MTGIDPALDPHAFDDPPLLGGGGALDDESLRPFGMAVGGLLVTAAAVTLLALLVRALARRFAVRHPVAAEVVGAGLR